MSEHKLTIGLLIFCAVLVVIGLLYEVNLWLWNRKRDKP